MKKKASIFSTTFIVFVLCILVLTLSSKDPSDDIFGPSTPCGELAGDEVYIQLNFAQPQAFNQYRQSSYQGFIPTPDVRTSGGPAGSLNDNDKYYCKVTVTTPQCTDWLWERILSNDNHYGSGKMKITIPPDGYDANIEVSYYETFDDPYNSHDFNKGSSYGTRLVYKFEQLYLNGWSGNIPQPVELYPTHLDKTINDPTSKYPTLRDYNTVNDIIDEYRN
ncbi:hypothetical protein [Sinomicrobium weinanense]|uniref:Uncharacterized protein n=1 Tax=Sinomicrobium weinanense TaxID=2842200 RepID=A0A926JSZ6_9FLAO|nr:hypothetical protein [Sinomicrobium weinanense]MBC9796754.1 hypothetical protein [Sinomicrobium weinanense]MBU3124025.1 hypothetical protein [Sinomicrobium weinanense]